MYGFRSTLPICYLEVKLFEVFRELGLRWRIKTKMQIMLKGESISFLVVIYRYEDTRVIDCTRKRGSLMNYYETLHEIYSAIHKFTHIE